MTVYVVTALAQEKDKYGTILRVDVRCFGAYTSAPMAQEIAAKHQAGVQALVLDDETNAVLQHWLNPGYARP